MPRTRSIVLLAVVITIAALGTPAIVGGESNGSPAGPDCTYPLTLTDATGTDVTLDEPADEIVVMHAGAAQTAQDIGIWDHVIGAPVAPHTEYLEDHDTPTDVTDDAGLPDTEVIVDLDPDIVIADHLGDPETIEALRDENLTVYMEPTPSDMEDIKSKVHTIGAMTDACEGATDRVAWMDDRLDQIAEHTDQFTEDPLIYYDLGDGYTTGDGTFQHAVIERAGGTNLAAEAGVQGWQPIDDEVVVDRDPDYLLYGDATDEPPVTEAVQATDAFQEDRTIAVDSDLFSQAGPRMVEIIETLADALADDQPETDDSTADDSVDDTGDDRSDADATDDERDDGVDEDAVDDGATDGDADETSDDETEEPLPAFGAIAAVVALLAGGLATRRR